MNNHQHGFTLIELILTILIISVLSVVAISRSSTQSINLDGQARQVANDIRFTQALAMHRGQRFRINFSSDRYSIHYLDNSPYSHPATNGTDILLASGISLSAAPIYIVYDSEGTPFTTDVLPGTPLSTDAVITLTASSGETKEIRIMPETGKASVL